MSKLALTLACGEYEIVRALMEGTVKPDGVDLNVLTAMDSSTRHWRFLRNREFDMAEVSCSSYLVARDQGVPIDAIPVFLHRRFRHGFIFINTAKGIRTPADLVGRKIGVKQFQNTAIVWLRGILQHEYGVPLHSTQYAALPRIYVQNSSLEIAWTRVALRQSGDIAGERVVAFLSDAATGFSIDYPEDWEAAERMLASGEATLPEVEQEPVVAAR